MQHEHEAMEQRVWQRVAAIPALQSPAEELLALVTASREAAAVCRQLMGGAGAVQKEALQRIYRLESENLSCLRGMCRLRSGSADSGKPLPVSKEPWEKALTRRYYCARRALTEYTARSADSEFGAVFHTMAGRQTQICTALVELLGGSKTGLRKG